MSEKEIFLICFVKAKAFIDKIQTAKSIIAAEKNNMRRNIKMFKKVISMCLFVIMVVTLCASMVSCNGGKDEFKLGVILLHDEASTYDNNFLEAVERAKKELNLTDDQVIYKKNIPESNASQTASATRHIFLRLLRSSRTFSSAMQQVQWLTLKSLTTSTMLSLLSTKEDSSQVLLQVSSSTR